MREYFLFKYPKKIEFENLKISFFKFDRRKIWFFFLLFFLIIFFFNFYFKIYQKGLLPIYDINYLISGIFKWLLLFGLSSLFNYFIYRI